MKHLPCTWSFGLGLVACIATTNANAQFTALPDSNATWITDFYDGPDLVWKEVYCLEPFDHDTLINDTLYSKLVASLGGGEFGGFLGGLFDNGIGQVFYYYPIAERAYLLYDFDVLPGDTVHDIFIQYGGGYDMVVLDVDTVQINGRNSKRISLEDYDYWIQGIGGTGGLLSTCGCVSISIYGILNCVSANDTIQYPVPDGGYGPPINCLVTLGVGQLTPKPSSALTVMPNPSMGLFELNASDALRTDVFDARGIFVLSTDGASIDLREHPAGVYRAVVVSASGVGSVPLVILR